jgi:hypothetical protein
MWLPAVTRVSGAELSLIRAGDPSNGADDSFAVQDHCSRVCGAKHRRAAGASLTVVSDGKLIGTGRVVPGSYSGPLGGLPQQIIRRENALFSASLPEFVFLL